MLYWPGFCLLWILDKIYFRTKVFGRENVPVQGPFILTSNHISNLDPFILSFTTSRSLNFLAKEELFKSPITSAIFYGLNAFPIKRGASDYKAIRETLRRLGNGKGLVMFPEGTRGVSSIEKKAQAGVGLIAVKSKAAIVPVYLVGTDKAFPPHTKWFKRHSITIYVGKPMVINENDSYETIANQIVTSIYALKPSLT